ncbi:glycosyltransferase family 2 protein [Desulfosporosinus sp. FKA]|uniref:glycosyltransferase family 2 protein n=1 Tax=Desulfosporosinus sp. FKA TaxID=1969834 RepID=UPI000B498F94|nr:glycosyltransferase family 2 protein [Desulfosporosinus sp. FKA]
MDNKLDDDLVSYDVYELDLRSLEKQVKSLGITSLIIWGVGANGKEAYRLLTNIGVEVDYYVDIKGAHNHRSFKKRKVLSVEEFKKEYNNEYILVTPSIHFEILDWLENNNIPKEKVITAFYTTEKIHIDFGTRLHNTHSDDIEYAQVRPENPAATFTSIVYNTPEHMFRRAIEGTLRQSRRDYMYVIIINGATDDSLAIANEYAKLDARIVVIDLDRNYRWTEPKLLNTIKDNIYGDYWCQLDSDDYYVNTFLEETLKLGYENEADIVCARTCLFFDDKNFNSFYDSSNFDFHDRYYFNVAHPYCHIYGHDNIMTALAKSYICTTFWGKLYSKEVFNAFLEDILAMPNEERDLYYRLDIAWTYHILNISERIYNSDKVLHYASQRATNSTFTLAPIEWLMSLCLAYKNIKREMYLYYKKQKAHKYYKKFIKIHLLFMINRKIDLLSAKAHPLSDMIIENLKMLFDDEVVKSICSRQTGTNKAKYKKFLNDMESTINEYDLEV